MKGVLAAGGGALLVAGLGFGLAFYRDALAHRGRILPGVSIMSIPVGGLTPELARRWVGASGVRCPRPRLPIDDAPTLPDPIAPYRTKFVNIPNRTHNIALAAGKLRG